MLNDAFLHSAIQWATMECWSNIADDCFESKNVGRVVTAEHYLGLLSSGMSTPVRLLTTGPYYVNHSNTVRHPDCGPSLWRTFTGDRLLKQLPMKLYQWSLFFQWNSSNVGLSRRMDLSRRMWRLRRILTGPACVFFIERIGLNFAKFLEFETLWKFPAQSFIRKIGRSSDFVGWSFLNGKWLMHRKHID